MSYATDRRARVRTELEVADFEREVLTELLRLHTQVLIRMPWVQLLLVAGLAGLVLGSVPVVMFAGWGCCTVAAEGLRAGYARKLLAGRRFDPRAAHERLIALAGLTAATVGGGMMLFMPRLALPDQALLCVIAFAMPAAGVSVAVSSKPILGFYALLILAPTALAWASNHPGQTLTAAGLTALYWGFILSVAADGEQLLRRSVAIRRELDLAVKNLEQRNREVSAAVAKAEQSAKARARVLAAASHDLRQPLHALSVYSAVLTAKPAPEALPELASNIDRLVRSLGGLLHGLLDLSRLSAEHYLPERQPVDLARVAEDVCQEYQTAAANKQLRLITRLTPAPLYDDALAIVRITRNLLDNAIKYTAHGEVCIETSKQGDSAVLIIEDTGKGIPAAEQERIFEEFYQLDNPGRDHARGIGLGLAIVQRLCELIGAELALQSEPGRGSRFTVRFRTLISDGGATAMRQDVGISFKGKRIVIVDDDIDILRSTSALLQSWQAEVDTAESSQDAWALFNQHGKPDLLIMDLRLRGGEQGAQLAADLQRRHGVFPVMIITGETASEALAQTRQAGYLLLQKPIAAEVLRRAVAQPLARK